jgi:hypothetical protein
MLELQNCEVQLDGGLRIARMKAVVKDSANQLTTFLHECFPDGFVICVRELADTTRVEYHARGTETPSLLRQGFEGHGRKYKCGVYFVHGNSRDA